MQQADLFAELGPPVFCTGWLRCLHCRVTWQTISTPNDAGRACPICYSDIDVVDASADDGATQEVA